MADKKIAVLDDGRLRPIESGDTPVDGDNVPVSANPWLPFIKTTDFNDQAASTSTITMVTDQTATIKVGSPIKFKLSGSYYYAICTAITSNLLTIADAPLTTGDGDLTELFVGPASQVQQISFFVSSTYADGTEDDLLRDDMHSPFRWDGPKAYCVFFAGVQATVDTGTEPKVNLEINNAVVSTNDSNNGIQLGAADTWVDNSAVAINTSNYDINRGEELEVACKVAGGTGDAANLTIQATLVLE